MLTAELTLGFLPLLYLAHLAGLDPRDLTRTPPLDLLVAMGGLGPAVAEFLAYLGLFAAYQLVLLVTLRSARFVEGENSLDRARGELSRGRDPRGLTGLLKITCVLAPCLALVPFLVGDAREMPRLVFVALVITLAAAQTLQPFTFGDSWRGGGTIDADLREMTRPGLAVPVVQPAPAGPSGAGGAALPGAAAADARPWFGVTPPRRGGGSDATI